MMGSLTETQESILLPRQVISKTQGTVYLATSSIVQMLCASAIVLVPTILPIITSNAGITNQVIGYFVAIIYMMAALTSLASVVGFIQKNIHAWYTASAMLCAIGVFLYPFLGGVWIYISAFCVGVGYGMLTPLGTIVASNLTSGNRGLVLSLRQAGVPASSLIAGLLFPVVCLAMGQVMLCFLLCMIIVLSSVTCFKFRPVCPQPNRKSLLNTTLNREAVNRTFLLVIAGALFAGVQMAGQSFLMAFLIQDLNLNVSRASSALVMFGVGGVGFRILFGALSDKITHPDHILIFLALFGALSYLSLRCHIPGVFLHFQAIALGASAYGWNGVYLLMLSRSVDANEYGIVFGLSTFVTNIGAIAIPMIVSFASVYAGSLHSAFFTQVVCYLIIAVLILLRKKPHRGSDISQ